MRPRRECSNRVPSFADGEAAAYAGACHRAALCPGPVGSNPPELRTSSANDGYRGDYHRAGQRSDPAIAPIRSAYRPAARQRSEHRVDLDGQGEPLRRPGCDVHEAGLVRELAIEIDRAGKAAPWLNAKKRGARLRPEAELAETGPGDVEPRSRTDIGDGAARERIDNDRIIIEQALGQRQHGALDRRRLTVGTHQAARQPPDRCKRSEEHTSELQ